LDPGREPVLPFGVMAPYKMAIRVLMEDNIPIKCEWVVPSSLKNLCWEKLKDLFVFPDEFDERW
jgi:hypothetical protein